MKILKRPKFKKVTCSVCGCVFVPSDKDIDPQLDGLIARCPVCRAACRAEPKKRPEVKPEGGSE